MPEDQPVKSPFQIPNIRLFIRFRVCFNSRFYYPVFTILFLDFGLSLEQFAILNAVWAATIVLCEVPSGALADTMGRRNLLVCAGVLMVVEMTLLVFAPQDNMGLLFWVFGVNRVISGLAEAAASGADEALAFDTLSREGDPNDWGRVLEKQMRLQSIAFIFAMSIGAAVYDPVFMQQLAEILGLSVQFDQHTTLRFPLILSLIMAVLTLITTLQMREISMNPNEDDCLEEGRCLKSIGEAIRLTLQSGRWISKTPFALLVILFAQGFDHIIRMLITLRSEYYRLIDLPEALFGLIGSGMSVMGLFMPRIALMLVERHTPLFNLMVIFTVTLAGLIGISFFVPYYGLLPFILLSGVMYMLNLFASHYLNQITASHQRATVLSFKGLSLNLAYGIFGVAYAGLLALLRTDRMESFPELTGDALETAVFIDSIGWFPWYFVLIMALAGGYACWRWNQNESEHEK